MVVYFNFPNLAAAKTETDAVPRVGEMVNTTMIKPEMFEHERDWVKYEHWEYKNFSFKVARVIWTPAAKGNTYVNVMLERIP